MIFPEFKRISHPFSLVLIGADALRAGRTNTRGWEYCLVGGERGPDRRVYGFIEFVRKGEHKVIKLAYEPEAGAPRTIQQLEPPLNSISATACQAPVARVHQERELPSHGMSRV